MKIAMPLMLAWYFQKRESVIGLADFGVAAYCGFGRRRPEELGEILDEHLRALAALRR